MKLLVAITAVVMCAALGQYPGQSGATLCSQVHLHPRIPMTYDEMLQQRLQALLEVH